MKELVLACLGVALGITGIIIASVAVSKSSPPSAVSAQSGTFSTIYSSNASFQYVTSPQIIWLTDQVSAGCYWSSTTISTGVCMLNPQVDVNCFPLKYGWTIYRLISTSCGTTSPSFLTLSVDTTNSASETVYRGPTTYQSCMTVGGNKICTNQTCSYNAFSLSNFSASWPFSTSTKNTLLIPASGLSGFLIAHNDSIPLSGTSWYINNNSFFWQSSTSYQISTGFTWSLRGGFNVLLGTFPPPGL
jgi:hypothetical protein